MLENHTSKNTDVYKRQVQVLKTPALNDILNIIKNYKIENNQLVIELTESGFIESNKNFIDFVMV